MREDSIHLAESLAARNANRLDLRCKGQLHQHCRRPSHPEVVTEGAAWQARARTPAVILALVPTSCAILDKLLNSFQFPHLSSEDNDSIHLICKHNNFTH